MATPQYCDLDLASGLNDGTTWANAWQTFAAAIAGLGAGETLYIKGTGTDGATINDAFNGTKDNPCIIIGVTIGTSAEPPTASDVVANRAATLPSVNVGGVDDIVISGGWAYVWGVNFTCLDNMFLITPSHGGLIAEECIFTCTDEMRFGEESEITMIWHNCNYVPVDAGSFFNFTGGTFEWHGGSVDAAVTPTSGLFRFGDAGAGISATFVGVDLTNVTGILFDWTTDFGRSNKVKLENCKMASGFTLGTRADADGWNTMVEANASKAGTGVSSHVPDMRKESYLGLIESETTIIRTGGASDGTNTFSIKMTPDDNVTYERYVGLRSYPLHGWLNSTSAVTVTIYVYNATADVQDDEVWADLFYAGNDSAQYAIKSTRLSTPLVTPSNLSDDTSLWPATAAFAQKLTFSITADHVGPMFAYVYYGKDTTSLPPLYVDPVLYVT